MRLFTFFPKKAHRNVNCILKLDQVQLTNSKPPCNFEEECMQKLKGAGGASGNRCSHQWGAYSNRSLGLDFQAPLLYSAALHGWQRRRVTDTGRLPRHTCMHMQHKHMYVHARACMCMLLDDCMGTYA